MTDQASEIAGLVNTIVEPLVEYPDEVEITPIVENDGTILIEVRVHEDDAGKVIGRQGRVIKAIRTISRAAASHNDAHVEVELVE